VTGPHGTRIAIGPEPVPDWASGAVLRGGGVIVEPEQAEGAIWLWHGSQGLPEFLARAPQAQWIDLASAGVDWLFREKIFQSHRVWTCSRGIYGPNVAELALTLLLCGYRGMRQFIRAETWLPESGRNLAGSSIGIVGGGGIGRCVASLVRPFDVHSTTINRSGRPVAGADESLSIDEFPQVIGRFDAVVLAVPLTDTTEKLMDKRLLGEMKDSAWLINVSRGRLIDTDALVEALQRRIIGGAGLDVTDPEPLPDGHPLWQLENCIITPHVASTVEMSPKWFSRHIEDNVRRFVAGDGLLGVVDPELQY
jgi:phosphoglycerate dehydrogenase-like enzyme